MRYYEGHEKAYRDLRGKGCHSWDEYRGQAADFDSFCMKDFVEGALGRSRFATDHPAALEIGCGTGPLCCLLASRGFDVEGIDISETAIAVANREAAERGLSVRYRVGDVCARELESQRYDLVVDGHCLHCIVTDQDRRHVLANVRRALRPGGCFWIETMVDDPAMEFGDGFLLDGDGILWARISTPGRFDVEKQVDGVTYVASRRIRAADAVQSELETAGFATEWSNAVSPEPGESGLFQAICMVD